MSITTPHKITESEITAYAERHGLTNLSAAQLARLAEIADLVADVSRRLPRMPSKSDEPAHVFRVPLK